MRLLVVPGLIAAVLVVVAVASGGSRGSTDSSSSGAQALAGTPARFAFLAAQHSNNCGLKPSGVQSTSPKMRLQGACCSAMDEAPYRAQVRGLRAYAAVPQVPADPYDISVRLARRLLSLDKRIRLRGAAQSTYSQAMAMSAEHGPCCCHCWRWEAFRGLSKYLIVQRDWGSGQLSELIGLLDGCGGPGGKASASEPRSAKAPISLHQAPFPAATRASSTLTSTVSSLP